MELYKLMEQFSGLCFVKVTEAKITEDGFDFVYDGCTYDGLIHDFIKTINKEKLVETEIEDFLIDIEDGKLVIHFYDHYYYRPGEKKTKVKLQGEDMQDFPSPLPF